MHTTWSLWQCNIMIIINMVSDMQWIDPFDAEFILGAFYIICEHWNGTDTWNPSSHKTRTHLRCMFNTIAADLLKMQGAKASAAMALTCLSLNIPVWAPKALTKLCSFEFKAISTRQIRTPVLRIPPAVTSQAKMKNWLHECQKWVSHMIGHYAHI